MSSNWSRFKAFVDGNVWAVEIVSRLIKAAASFVLYGAVVWTSCDSVRRDATATAERERLAEQIAAVDANVRAVAQTVDETRDIIPVAAPNFGGYRD